MSKKKRRKSTDIVPMMVRMREGLRRRIQREADERKTSMNAEILRRLNISFSEAEMNRAFNHALEPTRANIRAILEALILVTNLIRAEESERKKAISDNFEFLITLRSMIMELLNRTDKGGE